MIRSLFTHRHLIGAMTRAEFHDRYARQAIGSAWAWLTPLLLMGLYTAVFKVIYASRFAAGTDLPRDYVTYACSGLVVWLTLQDVIGRSPDALTGHASYIKQMAFPLEVLPVKRALASAPILLSGLVFLVGYQLVVFGSVPWTIVFLPLFLVTLLFFAVGLAYLLGALGVFFRDLREVVSFLLAANLFLLPVLFAPGSTPRPLQIVHLANPLSYPIWMHQDMVFYGRFEHPAAWIVAPALALATFAAGAATFRRLRPLFGDAI